MAYTSSDLYQVSHQPLADPGAPGSAVGTQVWRYVSLDTLSSMGASSYISDAAKRGLKGGDQLIVYNSSAPSLASFLVKTVRSSVTSGSADLSSGMYLSS